MALAIRAHGRCGACDRAGRWGALIPSRALFISYNGLLDPLGPTQILPYVELIAERWPVHVLSYERDHATAGVLVGMQRRLAARGIGWTHLRYHRRPGVVAKAWDIASGVRHARAIIARERPRVIHARGYVPMEIAIDASRDARILFDIRGLQGEEYVEGGIWHRRDPRLWLLKRSEERAFRRADAAVVLTRAILPYVRERFAAAGRTPQIEVIPTCVDTGRFRRDETARTALRAEIGATDRTVVFAYSGSLGTWYMATEMARFVRAFIDLTGRDAFLLWQLNTGDDHARKATELAAIAPERVRILHASPDEVVAQLSAADVGLALIRPTFSKRASAPTKYGEYLALGLPVVFSTGVGDSEDLDRRGVGIGVDEFTDAGLARAARRLPSLLDTPGDHFRAVATQLFGLREVAAPAYGRLYEALDR